MKYFQEIRLSAGIKADIEGKQPNDGTIKNMNVDGMASLDHTIGGRRLTLNRRAYYIYMCFTYRDTVLSAV